NSAKLVRKVVFVGKARRALELVLNINIVGNVREIRPSVHNNPRPGFRTDHHDAVIGGAREAELRPRARSNLFDFATPLLDFRTPHFGQRTNAIGLAANLLPNLVPKKLGAFSDPLS